MPVCGGPQVRRSLDGVAGTPWTKISIGTTTTTERHVDRNNDPNDLSLWMGLTHSPESSLVVHHRGGPRVGRKSLRGALVFMSARTNEHGADATRVHVSRGWGHPKTGESGEASACAAGMADDMGGRAYMAAYTGEAVARYGAKIVAWAENGQRLDQDLIIRSGAPNGYKGFKGMTPQAF